MLADERHHLVRVSRPDEVAHQRAARGGERAHHHEQDAAHAADDIGDGQRLLAQVFDVEEEQEPRGQRHAVLYHGPQRHVQHPAQRVEAEAGNAVQPILAQVDVAAGVDDEEHQRHRFGQGRPDGGSGNAQTGETAVAEDEQVVEHHVAQHHDDGVQRQRLGLRRAEEEGAEHDGVEREQRAEHPPMQVARGRLVYLRRGDNALQDDG